MSSSNISADKIRKLLERHHPREAFRIIATRMLLPEEVLPDPHYPSSVESRSMITLREKTLRTLRREREERVRLPADEEQVQNLVGTWCKGARVSTGDLVGVILYRELAKDANRNRKE